MAKAKPKVVHNKREKFDVYIGRPGPWGNPFVVGVHGQRGECINKFIFAFNNSTERKFVWMRQHIYELRGKILGCWCAPSPCHGDFLLKKANEGKP